MQPLIAKLILPWFGGSAAVWTSCMLFFQMALLGGYAYAHWMNAQPRSRQTVFHLVLLRSEFSVAADPAFRVVETGRTRRPAAADSRLAYGDRWSALFPAFVDQSAAAVLVFAERTAARCRTDSLRSRTRVPWLGLLAYPVLVEPYLTNGQQAWMWSIGYAAFVIVCGVVALLSRGGHAERLESRGRNRDRGRRSAERLLWMGLAACASALLLAVTNHLTQNVAAIPFLWVLPLSLYLLSFILCFDSDRWYDRRLYTGLGAISLGGIAYAISSRSQISGLGPSIAIFCSAVFILFMVCHGELARRRPSSEHLTAFFLMVSVGGAIGGLLIGFAAPYLFNALYDLPVVLSITALVLTWVFWRETFSRQNLAPGETDAVIDYQPTHYQPAIVVACVGAALGFGVGSWRGAATGFVTGAVFTLAFLFIRKSLARVTTGPNYRLFSFAVAAGLAVGLTGFVAKDTYLSLRNARVLARNFYGALVVYDEATDGTMGPVRVLRHGTIDHGEQFLWPPNQRFPTTYYARGSGIGITLQKLQPEGPMNVGVIGLGSGTLTTYARANDRYRVYDINPLVLRIAETQFTYLRDCLAPHDVVLGDARLSLESEPPQHFDVLAVDAFSGDAIPVHLLTREAYRLYWRHLKPDGVLAVHVSNRYLTLGPAVALGAAESGKTARMLSYEADDRNATEESDSDWVLVSSRKGFFDAPELKSAHKIDPIPGLRPWTDDYSNLYRILR